MCLGDVNLYFGGSSGNRGFLGPGCSDLPFLEPDILEKAKHFKTDILEKVKHFKTDILDKVKHSKTDILEKVPN